MEGEGALSRISGPRSRKLTTDGSIQELIREETDRAVKHVRQCSVECRFTSGRLIFTTGIFFLSLAALISARLFIPEPVSPEDMSYLINCPGMPLGVSSLVNVSESVLLCARVHFEDRLFSMVASFYEYYAAGLLLFAYSLHFVSTTCEPAHSPLELFAQLLCYPCTLHERAEAFLEGVRPSVIGGHGASGRSL